MVLELRFLELRLAQVNRVHWNNFLGIQLSTYDAARNFYVSREITSDDISADFTGSLTSGFFVCLGMNPFDVISTRMYNQKVDPMTGRGLYYTSIYDCFKKTLKAEGFGALYKGFGAHYIR
jgi:solute carrier family 25 protein 34/35